MRGKNQHSIARIEERLAKKGLKDFGPVGYQNLVGINANTKLRPKGLCDGCPKRRDPHRGAIVSVTRLDGGNSRLAGVGGSFKRGIADLKLVNSFALANQFFCQGQHIKGGFGFEALGKLAEAWFHGLDYSCWKAPNPLY